MSSFNKVVLMGRTTSVPELKETPNGVSVVNFNLAVDRGFGEDKGTDFFPIVAWRGTAEAIVKYVEKGQKILVFGSLQTRKWQDRDGNSRITTEVLATEFSFCDTKSSTWKAPSAEEEPSDFRAKDEVKRKPTLQVMMDDDVDIPF